MWPFQTKQLIAYLGEQHFVAHQLYTQKRQEINNQLAFDATSALNKAAQETGHLPAEWRRHQTTLRLAPSLGRCIALQAANKMLTQGELNGLAQHWAKTVMGNKRHAWQWKAVQTNAAKPILLCAYQVDSGYLKAFENVEPELLHRMARLDHEKTAWIICRDHQLIQSAHIDQGEIQSIRTWPSAYFKSVLDTVQIHTQLAGIAATAPCTRIVESFCGEVTHHEIN